MPRDPDEKPAPARRGHVRVRPQPQHPPPLAVKAIPRARRPAGRTCAAEAGTGNGARDNPRSRNARARRGGRIGPGQTPSGAAGVHAHTRRPTGETRAAKASTSAGARTSARVRPRHPPACTAPPSGVTAGRPGGRNAQLSKPGRAQGAREEDWRRLASAGTLAQRANESPPRAEEPASESQAALRAFLEAGEAEAQIETPLAEED